MQKRITLKLNTNLKKHSDSVLTTAKLFPEKMQFILANQYYSLRSERKLKLKTVLYHKHLINKLESMI